MDLTCPMIKSCFSDKSKKSVNTSITVYKDTDGYVNDFDFVKKVSIAQIFLNNYRTDAVIWNVL